MKKFLVLLSLSLLPLSSSGCGEDFSEILAKLDENGGGYNHGFSEKSVKLEDGDEVTCVIHETGVDCNWDEKGPPEDEQSGEGQQSSGEEYRSPLME